MDTMSEPKPTITDDPHCPVCKAEVLPLPLKAGARIICHPCKRPLVVSALPDYFELAEDEEDPREEVSLPVGLLTPAVAQRCAEELYFVRLVPRGNGYLVELTHDEEPAQDGTHDPMVVYGDTLDEVLTTCDTVRQARDEAKAAAEVSQ